MLVVNRWRCPLTSAAERYTTDRRANFDIYLPEWLQAQQIHFWCDLPRRYCIRTCALGARSKLASFICVLRQPLESRVLGPTRAHRLRYKPTKTFIQRTYLMLGYTRLREIAQYQTRWSVAATLATRPFCEPRWVAPRGIRAEAYSLWCLGTAALKRIGGRRRGSVCGRTRPLISDG